MAGIKGLNKEERKEATTRAKQEIDLEAQEERAEKFIRGAAKRGKSINQTHKQKAERCIFSLTKTVSETIDKISYMPKDFRAGRSDVVKAAIALLESQPEEEIIKQLMKIKHTT